MYEEHEMADELQIVLEQARASHSAAYPIPAPLLYVALLPCLIHLWRRLCATHAFLPAIVCKASCDRAIVRACMCACVCGWRVQAEAENQRLRQIEVPHGPP